MIISGGDLLVLLAGGVLFDRELTLYGKPIVGQRIKRISAIEVSRKSLEQFAENLKLHMKLSYSNVAKVHNKLDVLFPSEEDRKYWENFFECDDYRGGLYRTTPSRGLEAAYRGLLMMKATTSSEIRRAAEDIDVKVIYQE